jgi:hypothetical protein
MVRGSPPRAPPRAEPARFNLGDCVRFWLANAEQRKCNLKVQVDIDPQSFF